MATRSRGGGIVSPLIFVFMLLVVTKYVPPLAELIGTRHRARDQQSAQDCFTAHRQRISIMCFHLVHSRKLLKLYFYPQKVCIPFYHHHMPRLPKVRSLSTISLDHSSSRPSPASFPQTYFWTKAILQIVPQVLLPACCQG